MALAGLDFSWEALVSEAVRIGSVTAGFPLDVLGALPWDLYEAAYAEAIEIAKARASTDES